MSNLNSGPTNLRKLQKKKKLLSDKSTFENLVSLRTPADKVLILLIDESKKKLSFRWKLLHVGFQ
jgi:hypothetical protein